MCVLSIKVPIQKTAGNVFIFLVYIYIHIYIYIYIVIHAFLVICVEIGSIIFSDLFILSIFTNIRAMFWRTIFVKLYFRYSKITCMVWDLFKPYSHRFLKFLRQLKEKMRFWLIKDSVKSTIPRKHQTVRRQFERFSDLDISLIRPTTISLSFHEVEFDATALLSRLSISAHCPIASIICNVSWSKTISYETQNIRLLITCPLIGLCWDQVGKMIKWHLSYSVHHN